MRLPTFRLSVVAVVAMFLALQDSLAAEGFSVQQTLRDGVNDVDGLDNPRQVIFSLDGSHAFVTSADDNALLVVSLKPKLTTDGLFKNSENSDFQL